MINKALNQPLIQPHLVRDLVGLDEDRLGFRSGFVGGVLEVRQEQNGWVLRLLNGG
jgi:hypothetical protein